MPDPGERATAHQNPFKATPTSAGAQVQAASAPELRRLPSLPIRSRAKWAQIAIALAAVAAVVQAGATLNEIRVLQDLRDGNAVSFDRASTSDDLVGMAALFYFGMLILSIVTFSLWTHRAHKNLELLAVPSLRFSPGWSVGWFFVPIMNLFRPFQAVAQLWRASAHVGERKETQG